MCIYSMVSNLFQIGRVFIYFWRPVYMHDLPPPMKVILSRRLSAMRSRGFGGANVQVGVDSGNPCVGDCLGELFKPPLRLPLVCVVAPDGLVMIGCLDANPHLRALRNGDLIEVRPVYGAHRFREMQHGISHGPTKAP